MAGLSYYSIQTYTYLGGDSLFTVPFPYIKKSDVAVYVNGTQLVTADFEWNTDTQIRILSTLVTNDKVVVRRFTRKDRRWAEYNDGAILTENDLNLTTVQLLYLIQELYDFGIAGAGGDPPPGGVGGPGDPGDPGNQGIIDQVIADLLNTQLFTDLITLIDMVDINAESVMSTIINTHERWGEDRRYGGLVRQLDQGLDTIDTRITDVQTELITDRSATATTLNALQARFNTSEADIIDFREVYASDEEARTLRIEVAESRIGSAQVYVDGLLREVPVSVARIGHIEETYADREEAEAYVQTQLDAKFAPESLDGYINATSVITGIKAKADKNAASVESVASYLVGSGYSLNPDGSVNWPANPPGGIAQSLAGLSQTVNGRASQLAAELEFRTALAARYNSGNLDANTMVTSIENAWKVYADENSAVASQVNTLQANRQPIFFRETPPDPTSTEFEDTPYATAGFPEGSLWYQKVGAGGYYPFMYRKNTTVPSNLMWFGPYFTNHRWIQVVDTAERDFQDAARGALVQTIAETYVRDDQILARLEHQLQVVNGINYAGLNETLETYFNLDTGLMYSSWNVRINQSSQQAGVPVIAGVGLGMQQDLNNPSAGASSQFIVMADKFGVVKPPDGGDVVAGEVDLTTVRVPFVVDTASGNVIISETLLANSMKVFSGVAGRLEVRELDNNFDPVGTSYLVLPSGRAAGNLSTSTSPFTGGSQKYLIWAGSGDMNHNNATFYVDTDGNAKFNGDIQANNVSGNFQGVVPISWNGSINPATGGSITFSLPAPYRAGASHTPVISLGIHIQNVDSGTGSFRLQLLQNGSLIAGSDMQQEGSLGIHQAFNAIGQPTTGQADFELVVSNISNGHRVRVQSAVGHVFGIR